ncbi:hypothetical protein MFRU_017g00160 [Monilinia fructicola]|uniref:3',5'-cyclic-nucleotide phosphodiesterase n=1 Tax=Monilinia fructicola TaxID=38448 RepID=A0A5M9JGY4_MONFR|nr:hypothetical protein EYC84_007792 [Monilinia fructicola]KAG4029077.1 hypothetical protein MFRU_017g00160 [Monilinia fructicola]
MAAHIEEPVDSNTSSSFQVIVLGAGGGPMEDNCTALLVRSTTQGWTKGSLLAVDAGVHLSAIDRLLRHYDPLPSERPHRLHSGVLAGLLLPHKTTAANSAHIARNIVGAHLITHPHLDHISGGIISTACPSSKPRKIAGLQSTIEALKNHIFNDVIWPNLSDEDGGVGLVTFMRLNSGGSSVLGDGVTKGYMEVAEGLCVKSWEVSHGNCAGDFPYRNLHAGSDILSTPVSPRRPSIQSQRGYPTPLPSEHNSKSGDTPNLSPTQPDRARAYTSSAFFIHDVASGEEILIWGDVEPDSISSNPRNKQVWIDAAPKIAAGKLKGIFIECSYDDSRPDEMLFGHLNPRYVIEELEVLAAEVERYRDHGGLRYRRGSNSSPTSDLTYTQKHMALREKRELGCRPPLLSSTARKNVSGGSVSCHDSKGYPLKGVKVVLIHLKERLDDGEELRDVILREIKEYEEEVKLGCEFLVSEHGMSVNF